MFAAMNEAPINEFVGLNAEWSGIQSSTTNSINLSASIMPSLPHLIYWVIQFH